MCAQQTNRRKDPVPRRYSSATGRSLRASRSGLAPLEMVLGLPLVLLLFALMVNAGFTGMWKLRLLGAASEAAWRDRDQRNSLSDPEYRSTFWKQPDPGREESPLTTSRGHAEDPLNIPDQAFAEAVRADFRSLDVDSGLLDPKQDSYSNNANIRRHFPLLPDSLQMMQGNLNYMLVAHTLPYWKTRLPTMQCRRTKVLYNPVEEPEEASNEGPTDYIMNTGYWPDAYQWDVGQRTIWGIETDIPGSSLPTLSEWTVHPSELGFDSFLSVADEYHNSLLNTNLLPVAGHNVTVDLLTALGEMEAYHDRERYDWTYKGEFLDDGMVKWCWLKLIPPAPGFMPSLDKIVSDDGTEWNNLINPIIERVIDDKDLLTKDLLTETGAIRDPEGNLPYHLAGSYINFYQSAIDIVTHHVDHLNNIIDQGDEYLALPKKEQDPAIASNYREAKAGAQQRVPAAQKELDRREGIISPIIKKLEGYQQDF